MTPPEPLTFSAVDGLGFAASTGVLDVAENGGRYAPACLGPVIELLSMVASGKIPSAKMGGWILQSGATPMIRAFEEGRESWLDSGSHRAGFVRAERPGTNGDALFTKFLMDAKRAASEIAGLPGTAAGQMVGAMAELESNIHEHSEAVSTGILAFRAVPGTFEFIAADRGIGVLKSLGRTKRYSALGDHGLALQAALKDGASRFENDCRRGFGFRPIFLGLVNLHGSLRFRSGDYALLMDGTDLGVSTAQLAQKPSMDGFLASVRCDCAKNCERLEVEW